ncbi:unnamed protein product [Protopolystoma xenopodis]|uniref:Uncharacterized protein n=1 Tax=Protopolystoma xenopodis TaxID=117903 RepID=A0A448X2I0_9PLAT|nr:unnamed protein product [Protopolystoma xenopodis]
MNLGRPNWEHLNDRLHVLLIAEDTEARAKVRLARAKECITLFLNEGNTPFLFFSSVF